MSDLETEIKSLLERYSIKEILETLAFFIRDKP